MDNVCETSNIFLVSGMYVSCEKTTLQSRINTFQRTAQISGQITVRIFHFTQKGSFLLNLKKNLKQ